MSLVVTKCFWKSSEITRALKIKLVTEYYGIFIKGGGEGGGLVRFKVRQLDL